MNIKTLCFLALLISPCLSAFAADKHDPAHWTEDFTNEDAFYTNWGAYGWLPDGTVSGKKEDRVNWWRIVDGALRGETHKLHPSGLTHVVSGRDVRMKCRFKLGEGAMVSAGYNGPNPLLERNFHLAGVHITAEQIRAYDEDVLHPKGSPEAEALKKEGKMNRKFIGSAKAEKLALTVNAWHDLKIEMRGKEITVWIDAKQVLNYKTLSGDAPKTSLQFAVGNASKNEMAVGWYDDVVFEPITEEKKP
jgi:hypothetical protein